MKNYGKIFAMLLSVSIVLNFMTALDISAASENAQTASYDLTLLQEGGFPELTFSADDYEAERTEIRNALMNYENQIDISVSDMESYNLAKLYETVINNSPKLYNVVGQVSIEKLSADEYRIYPVYKSEVEVMAYFDTVENAVDDILGQIKPEMNDIEKILTVHDYMLAHYEFDLTYSIYSANGFFVNKRGVCQAYMLAFKYIMDELGIPCQSVISQSMDHGWNIVQIGGSWYHVDVTWDDPTTDVYGRANHDYLLLSDSAISNSAHKHYNWSTGHTATSTKYDNYLWTNANTPMQYYNGEWYYAKGGQLYKFSIITNTQTSIPTPRSVGVMGIYNENMLFLNNNIIYTAPMNNLSDVSKLDNFTYAENGLTLDGAFFADGNLYYALVDKRHYNSNNSNYYNYRYYYWMSLTENIQWTYKNGVLTIRGKNGVIPDCGYGGAPWAAYSNDITSVVVREGVKKIGKYAFSNLSNLTSVSLPDSLTAIGDYAFYDCYALNGVYITSLSAWCGISFGNEYANPLYYAKNNLYVNNVQTTDIIIPNGVTSIGDYAFYNFAPLKGNFLTITIPDSVTSIGKDAFYGCNFWKVYITNLSAWCGISFGNGYAHPLHSVDHLYVNNERTYDIIIPDGTTSIGDYAFYGCKRLHTITIPKSVKRVGDSAFYGCSNLGIVYFDGSEAEWTQWMQTSSIANNNSCLTDAAIFCEQRGWGKITDGYFTYTAYGDYAVLTEYKGTSAVSVKIPSEIYGIPVTGIGDSAFYNCSGLTSVSIPDSVTSIGNYAFYNCQNLTTVTIPDGVTSIGDNVFDQCLRLTSITIPNSVTSIGDSAFYGCSRLTSITIPDSVTSIGDSAFSWCYGLTSVIIPDSVTSIGDYVFQHCIGLTSVTIPDSVTNIGHSAFFYCWRLTSVTIPDSVTSIGYSAFYGCGNISDVYYEGSQDEWNEIDIGTSNSDLTKANIHYRAIESNKIALNNGRIKVSALSAGAYKMIFAEYNNRKLANTQMIDVTFDDAGVKYIDIPSDMNKDGVQVFLWNSLDKMKPLCSPITIKQA